jgi:hypothetical protein
VAKENWGEEGSVNYFRKKIGGFLSKKGATTLGIMTFSIMTLSKMTLSIMTLIYTINKCGKTRGQCYKTFYSRRLRLFIIS